MLRVAAAVMQVGDHASLDCDSVSKMENGMDRDTFWKRREDKVGGFSSPRTASCGHATWSLKVTQGPGALLQAPAAPHPAPVRNCMPCGPCTWESASKQLTIGLRPKRWHQQMDDFWWLQRQSCIWGQRTESVWLVGSAGEARGGEGREAPDWEAVSETEGWRLWLVQVWRLLVWRTTTTLLLFRGLLD